MSSGGVGFIGVILAGLVLGAFFDVGPFSDEEIKAYRLDCKFRITQFGSVCAEPESASGVYWFRADPEKQVVRVRYEHEGKREIFTYEDCEVFTVDEWECVEPYSMTSSRDGDVQWTPSPAYFQWASTTRRYTGLANYYWTQIARSLRIE